MNTQEKVYTIEDIRDATYKEDIRLLLNILQTSNFNLNDKYENGLTPLSYAINIYYHMRSPEVYFIIKLLLKFGADPNLEDNINCESRIFSAEYDERLVGLLLEYNFDVFQKLPDDTCWLLEAYFMKDYELAIFLMKKGMKRKVDPSEVHNKISNKFFEECEFCDNVLNCSRIKGAVKVEKFNLPFPE